MYTIEYAAATLPARDYVAGYRDEARFMECCRACNRYGRTWTCPPYTYRHPLSEFGYAHILGTRLRITEEARHRPASAREAGDEAYRLMAQARHTIDARLLAIEADHAGSLAFMAGSCTLCDDTGCTRPDGLPCRYPKRARPSLEAYGFDVGRTAEKLLGAPLLWCDGPVLPEYLTLVCAIFSNDSGIAGLW